MRLCERIPCSRERGLGTREPDCQGADATRRQGRGLCGLCALCVEPFKRDGLPVETHAESAENAEPDCWPDCRLLSHAEFAKFAEPDCQSADGQNSQTPRLPVAKATRGGRGAGFVGFVLFALNFSSGIVCRLKLTQRAQSQPAGARTARPHKGNERKVPAQKRKGMALSGARTNTTPLYFAGNEWCLPLQAPH